MSLTGRRRTKVKFNNKKTGKYRSKLESDVYKTLPKVKGMKVAYEKDYIRYMVPGYYLPDFTVTLPNGKTMYIEVKGYFRIEDKRKMAAVKRDNPELDIRFVFSSKSKKNEKWCIKHGYPFAVGKVPKEWLV